MVTNLNNSTYAGAGYLFACGLGAELTAAATISITDSMHVVSGSTTITTINGGSTSNANIVYLIKKASSTWKFGTGGNLSGDLPTAIPDNSVITMTWDQTYWRIAAIGQQSSITLTPQMFGAAGDGTTYDTAAITAALAYISDDGPLLFFPNGTYLISGSGTIFTCSAKNTRIVCDSGVVFKLVPTAAATVFKATNGANVLYGFSLTGNPRFHSDNTTYKKTMVELRDTSGAVVELCSIEGGWTDSGHTSIGILIEGRDFGTIDSLAGISADRPIVVSDNPNSYIDLDSWVFGSKRRLLTIANSNPNFEIGDCYSLNSDWYLSCNKGTDGLVFNGSSNPTTSTSNTLRVHFEQGTSATGWAVDWRAASSRNLKLLMCDTGTPNKGFKIRNATHLTVEQCEYNLTSNVALDFTTCDQVELRNNFWQATSTFVTTGLTRKYALSQFASAPAPGAPFELWVSDSNTAVTGAQMSLLQEFRATSVGVTIPASNAATISVPGLSGNAVRGKFLLIFSGAADGAAEFAFSTTALYPIGGAANLPSNLVVGVPSANHVGVVFNSQGSITVYNDYGSALTAWISATYFF